MGQALILKETTGLEKVSKEIKVEQLSPMQIMHFWPAISTELLKVPFAWEKWWTLDSLYARAVESGTLQVWSAGTADRLYMVVFSQIAKYPQRNIFQVFLAIGGRLRECLPMLEATLTKFALDHDCTTLEVVGREGWARWLYRYGFRIENVVMGKEIRKEGIH